MHLYFFVLVVTLIAAHVLATKEFIEFSDKMVRFACSTSDSDDMVCCAELDSTEGMTFTSYFHGDMKPQHFKVGSVKCQSPSSAIQGSSLPKKLDTAVGLMNGWKIKVELDLDAMVLQLNTTREPSYDVNLDGFNKKDLAKDPLQIMGQDALLCYLNLDILIADPYSTQYQDVLLKGSEQDLRDHVEGVFLSQGPYAADVDLKDKPATIAFHHGKKNFYQVTRTDGPAVAILVALENLQLSKIPAPADSPQPGPSADPSCSKTDESSCCDSKSCGPANCPTEQTMLKYLWVTVKVYLFDLVSPRELMLIGAAIIVSGLLYGWLFRSPRTSSDEALRERASGSPTHNAPRKKAHRH